MGGERVERLESGVGRHAVRVIEGVLGDDERLEAG